MRTIYILIEINEKSNYPNLIRREKILKITKDNREKKKIPNSRWPPGRAKVEWPMEDRRRPNRTAFPFTKNTHTPTLGTAPAPAPAPASFSISIQLGFFLLTVHRSQLFLFLLGSHSHSSNFLFIYFLCVGRLGSSVTCVTNVSVFSQLNVDTSGI